jgi:hypothetical protein
MKRAKKDIVKFNRLLCTMKVGNSFEKQQRGDMNLRQQKQAEEGKNEQNPHKHIEVPTDLS